ncbi:hypothetical protein LCGC14_1538400 [marine sediment metagenome]|uniref:Methyltransferase domain-containing protein n=1 Tax=marine sediment metagenome TaxID=412755 RepID=A0A0F9JEU1_9ZZZZ
MKNPINYLLRLVGYEVRKKLPYLRPSMQYIHDNLGEELIGVEVGVYEGEHALRILNKLSITKLFLVDPFLIGGDYEGDWMPNKTQDEFDQVELKARTILGKFGKKKEFIMKPSVEAAKEFNDDSFDFVYIDGAHSYKDIKEDIDTWYPKVRKGGVLAGHNIQNHLNPAEQNGVADAVVELVTKKSYKLHIGSEDWWIVK